MLIQPTLAILTGLIILFGVGIGPAMLLLHKSAHRHMLASAIAPALGLAIFDILAFPLFVYIGPVEAWVWPVTVGVLAISVGLALWRGFPLRVAAWKGQGLAFWLGWFGLTLLVLVSPLLILGIQYAAFRSNPSDAFFYMSLAETARVTDWQILEKGIAFTANNLENLKRLAEQAPASLLTARLIARPTSFNHMAAMAWLAELGRVPIYQFYYAYHMLLLAAMMPVVIAIGHILRLRRTWLALAGAAAVLGFWAKHVVEMDASYELSTVPILALAVIAWMLLERESWHSRWKLGIMLALALATLSMIYFPVLSVFLVGLVILGCFHLFQRQFRIFLFTYLAVGAMAFLVMALSGQLLFHVRGLLVGPDVLELQRGNVPSTIQVLMTDWLGGFVNLPVRTLFHSGFPTISNIFALLIQLGSLLLLLSLAYWLLRGPGIRAHPARRVLVSTVAGGMIIFGLLMIDGNPKAAGKALTYSYIYFLLLLLVAVDDLTHRLPAARTRALSTMVSGWLVLVIIVGATIPYNPYAANRFSRGRAAKMGHEYDLSPILSEIAAAPGFTLINVPRDNNWIFSYYVMLALGGHPSQYQSGLVMDNSVEYYNLWTHPLEVVSDYVLTSAADDGMAETNRGPLIAETGDLRLYRVTSTDLSFFQSQVAASQADDAVGRMPFPSWQP